MSGIGVQDVIFTKNQVKKERKEGRLSLVLGHHRGNGRLS